MLRIDADVAVLGSGFGGSLIALILHRMGLQPVLIDRTSHPRFAIGESSTPIANMVLRDLAQRYDLPRLLPLAKYGTAKQSYPHVTMGLKRGFSYFKHEPHQRFTPSVDHDNELLVAASSDDVHADTHWLRAGVDAFFASEVQAANIPYLDRTTIDELNNANGWHLVGRREEAIDVRARFAIDATGDAGVLLRALDVPSGACKLSTNSRAIFGHFRGVRPWHEYLVSNGGNVADHPFCCDNAALHHVLDGGWMWQLRFRNGVTSAGFVLNAAMHPLDLRVPPTDEWDVLRDRYPSIAEQFRDAELVDPPDGLRRTGRMQRIAKSIAGEDWVALPNTAGFIDPLHSTGIAQTMCGVERLAWAFEAFRDASEMHRRLRQYESTVRSELEFIDQLVHGCWSSMANFDIFATYAMMYFAAATTYEHRRHEGRIRPDNAFLGADDQRLRDVVATAYDLIRDICAGQVVSDDAMRFQHHVAEAIEPFNIVGLCDPKTNNMYRYTAAPV